MYPVSTHFSEMMRSANRQIGVKIVINGVEYGSNSIVDMSLEYCLSPSGKFTIGNIISTRLDFSLREFDLDIAENALIEPYVRFEGGLIWNEAHNEWDNEDATWNFDETEWIPLGKYRIDNRVYTEQKLWVFECYDATVSLHQEYISNLVYPQNMRDVLREVCAQVGLEIANIDSINATYQIYLLPTEITLHKMISHIASANCCSAVMDRNGKLKFIKFSPEMYNTPVDTITRRDYFKAKRTNDIVTIDTVKLYEKDDFTEGEFSELVRGSGSEYTTLKIVNPFMNEGILDDVYDTLNGFEYIPYELDYKCFPNLEIGDVITIEQSMSSSWLETSETWGTADFSWDYDIVQFNVIVLYNKIVFKGGLRSTVKAESESKQTSEFKIKGSLREYVENIDKSTIKEGKIYNGVTTSREHGVVVERSDGKAKVTMNATEGISIFADAGLGLSKNFFVGLDGRIVANGIDISGDATFGGELSAATGTFKGTLSGVDGTFSGTISASTIIGGTISGTTISGVYISGSTIEVGDGAGQLQIKQTSTPGYSYGELWFMDSQNMPAIGLSYNPNVNEFIINDMNASNDFWFISGANIYMSASDDINFQPYGGLQYWGDEIATQVWVDANFVYDGTDDYVKSHTGQDLSIVATETGIVIRVDGVTLGSIFYD